MNKVDVVNAVTTKPGLPASPFGRTGSPQISIGDRGSNSAKSPGRRQNADSTPLRSATLQWWLILFRKPPSPYMVCGAA